MTNCTNCPVQQGYKPAEAAHQIEEPDQRVSDAAIDAVFDGMPDGTQGFLKSWGYRQFARGVLALAAPAAQAVEPFYQWWSNGGHKTVSAAADSRGWQGAAEAGYNAARAARSALAAPQAQDVQAVRLPQWLPIESAPKNGRTLWLGYMNESGRWRSTRGEWVSEEHIAEYWDNDEAPEGWYETPVEGEECYPIAPTHWMPLPGAPAIAASAKGGV